MAGRPSKPTRLKVLQGNPGKRALPRNEPQPERGAPTRPGWMTPEGKREWNRIVPHLTRMGLLAKIDRAMLVMLCETWSEFVTAKKDVEEAGAYYTMLTGSQRQRPCVARMNAALERYGVLAAKFGLDPSDRAKMSTPPMEEENDFAKFLKGQAAVGE